RQRFLEREPLGAKLEDQERRVAGRLDVEGDELSFFERRQRTDLGRVDRDLLPGHGLDRAAGLQEELVVAQREVSSALRAHAISSRVTARRSRTATPYTTTPTAIGIRTSRPLNRLSGYTAAPISRPASKMRQLRAGTAIRPTWRATRIQPAIASTSSVATVAQLAPWSPKSGI